MVFKLVVLCGLVSVARAGYLNGGGLVGGGSGGSGSLTLGASRSPIITSGGGGVGGYGVPLASGHTLPAPGYTAPAAVAIHAPGIAPAPVHLATRIEPYDPHPQYAYSYDVNDHVTGDSKSQVEHRNGDVVQGRYSLTDPDGSRRTVDYVADPHNGFNAIVSRQPPPAPLLAPHQLSAHP